MNDDLIASVAEMGVRIASLACVLESDMPESDEKRAAVREATRRMLDLYRDTVKGLHADNVGLRANVFRLEHALGQLPKTADGVPVTPGMKVFWRDDEYGDIAEQIVVNVNAAGLGDGQHPIPWSRVYSTPEALKAAEDAEEAGA